MKSPRFTEAQAARLQQRTARSTAPAAPTAKPASEPKRKRKSTKVDTGTVSRGELNYFHLHTMVRTKNGIDWLPPKFERTTRTRHWLLR